MAGRFLIYCRSHRLSCDRCGVSVIRGAQRCAARAMPGSGAQSRTIRLVKPSEGPGARSPRFNVYDAKYPAVCLRSQVQA
jgi:hypothetical protein